MGGLEGVFYSLLPLTFMDGIVVWRWNRFVWALLFGVTTFLFWQLVINQYAAYMKAFEQPTVIAILLILAVYGTLTVVTWLYFKYRRARQESGGSGDASLRSAELGGGGPTGSVGA